MLIIQASTIVITAVLVILIFFICGLLFILRKESRFIKEINKINQELSEVEGRSKRNIMLIDEIINDNYFLREDWLSYKQIVKHDKQSNNILDPSNFLHSEKIISKYVNRNIAQTLPSILTGLGILGTFIGLFVGLRGLGDFENIQAQLPLLIGGMKVSFVSSIAGISCSILFSLLDRKMVNSLKNEINTMNINLREILPIRIESNILEEIAKNQKMQVDATKEFITDSLVPEIVNGLQEAVEVSLSPKMDEMNQTVKKMANTATDKQAETIDKLVNKFMSTFNETFDHQFEELKETLESMIDWQKRNREEMEILIDKIELSAERQNKLLGNTDELLTNMENYILKFDKLNNSLNENVESLNKLTEKLTELEGKTNDKLEKLIERQDALDDKRKEHIDDMDRQIKQIDAYWEAIQGDFKELNSNLKGAMEQFANNTYEGLERTFEIFDENLSTISDKLAVTIQELNETIEEMPQSFNQLKEIISEIDQEREELIRSLNEQSNIIDKNFSEYSSNLDYRFNDLKNDIKKEIAEEMPGNLEQLEEHVKVFLNNNEGMKYDLERALKKFNDKIENNLDELKDDIIDKFVQEFESNNKGFFSRFKGD